MTIPSTILEPAGLNNKLIADRMRRWRVNCGLTVDGAAKRIGCTKGKLSKAENNKQNFTLEFVMKYAAAMGVQMDYLVGLSNNPEGDPLQNVMATTLRVTETILTNQLKELTRAAMSSAISAVTMESKYQSHEKTTGDLIAAVTRFVELNKTDFEEEMRGSSPVLKHLDLASGSLLRLTEERERQTKVKTLAADETYIASGKDMGLIAFQEALEEEYCD